MAFEFFQALKGRCCFVMHKNPLVGGEWQTNVVGDEHACLVSKYASRSNYLFQNALRNAGILGARGVVQKVDVTLGVYCSGYGYPLFLSTAQHFTLLSGFCQVPAWHSSNVPL